MKIIVALFAMLLFCSGCARIEDDVAIPEPTQPSVTEDQTKETTECTAMIVTDPVEMLINNMTLEERVGQIFLVAVPQNEPLEAIESYHFGGVLLFGNDFTDESPERMEKKITEYQQAAAVPMFIAVDEEGGTVCRVSSNSLFRETRFLSPRNLYEQGGCALLIETEIEKCNLLKSVGINVNLAPVCDISTDPNAFLYKRSLGLSPEETAYAIEQMILVMDAGRIGSVMKHFPGYGNNTDTHVASAIDERTLDTLESSDLIPFRAGVAAGCEAIMVSHTIVNAFDPDSPASLSPLVHTYLRNKMGFEGVIVTDDLGMAAVASGYEDGEAAVKAVLAGNDLLCTGTYEKQYEAVLNAVISGEIPEERLNASVLRILRWKQHLGLLQDLIIP